MNTRLFLMAALMAGGMFANPAWAQDAGNSGAAAGGATASGQGGGGHLSFLSADDRQHLLRVRQQVLEQNPDLKTEQESLQKERQYVRDKGADATSDDKAMLRNNFMAHNEKMSAAMVKADPTVQPILEQVKEHMKQRWGQPGAGGNQ